MRVALNDDFVGLCAGCTLEGGCGRGAALAARRRVRGMLEEKCASSRAALSAEVCESATVCCSDSKAEWNLLGKADHIACTAMSIDLAGCMRCFYSASLRSGVQGLGKLRASQECGMQQDRAVLGSGISR